MKCNVGGCERESINKRKPGPCNTCKNRRHTGASPKFPTQPLLDYVDRHRGGFPHDWDRPQYSKISLERLDAICIDLLGVHPYQVYGDLYFQECVS